jgi:hypothetical protein
VPKKRSSTITPESWWQLRIELLGVDPRVWRRIFVPNTIALPKLDRVIQVSMGWANSHLHEFVIGGVRYGVPDPDFARELAHVDERNVELKDALGANARCFDYVYDFGDDWQHAVLVEDPNALASKIQCIAGENACPPEDVGGSPGYERFLEAIADRKHAEHREMLDWIGGSFDPGHFDIVDVNRALADI